MNRGKQEPLTALDFGLIRRECGTAPGGRREFSGDLRTPDGEETPTEFLPIDPDSGGGRARTDSTTELTFISLDRSDSEGMARQDGMNLSPRGSFRLRRQMGRGNGAAAAHAESTALKGLLNSFAMEERLCSARNNGQLARPPAHLLLQIPDRNERPPSRQATP